MIGIKKSDQPLVGWTVLFAVLLIAPHLFYPVFLMKVLCFALFACAFNLLLGYVGLLSFGHAAFFGSAGYITAYTVKALGFNPVLGILAGVATSTVLGLIIGWLAIRRSGIYFAMITLGLAQVIFFLSMQLPFTAVYQYQIRKKLLAFFVMFVSPCQNLLHTRIVVNAGYCLDLEFSITAFEGAAVYEFYQ